MGEFTVVDGEVKVLEIVVGGKVIGSNVIDGMKLLEEN